MIDGSATMRTKRFQSTPLMRGETWMDYIHFLDSAISIHSPHARGDLARLKRLEARKISIHSPHARGDAI